MAATHARRRKSVGRAESTTYRDSSLVPTLDLTNTSRENAEFVLTLQAHELTAKQLVLRILQISGPYTTNEIHRIACEKYRRDYSGVAIRHAIHELRKLGLVAKSNGGYAIHNWEEIGA